MRPASDIKNSKSSKESLRKRGMIDQNDINLFLGKSDKELYHMIHSDIATERTCAVRILAERGRNDMGFIEVILEQLCREKSLYTRLEICSVLEQGDTETARRMVKYLGVIGSNQYKELPQRSSKKVSYPLPRDIVARTLSKMSPNVFEVLLEALEEDNLSIVSEGMDAVGSMVFYNRQLATPSHAEFIYGRMEKYKDNKLIIWKAIMCLSAFSLNSSVEVLEKIKSNYPATILSEEAERSLRLIKKNGC